MSLAVADHCHGNGNVACGNGILKNCIYGIHLGCCKFLKLEERALKACSSAFSFEALMRACMRGT